MIWKNFVRDLRRTASRLISVSIITMIAVMVYTALSGILTNIERISASYLEGQNVADYWLQASILDQGGLPDAGGPRRGDRGAAPGSSGTRRSATTAV